MFSKRLKAIVDHFGISVTAFEVSVGVSKGVLAKPIKHGRTVGVEVLEKIFKGYPSINLEWLITGNGLMLKDSNTDIPASPDTVTISKDEYIDLQQKALQVLDERIAELKRELGKR